MKNKYTLKELKIKLEKLTSKSISDDSFASWVSNGVNYFFNEGLLDDKSNESEFLFKLLVVIDTEWSVMINKFMEKNKLKSLKSISLRKFHPIFDKIYLDKLKYLIKKFVENKKFVNIIPILGNKKYVVRLEKIIDPKNPSKFTYYKRL